MSYLSPLPHYPATRTRSRDWKKSLSTEALWQQQEASAPRRRPLLHPLYSEPQRYYSLANGHQVVATDYPTVRRLRRPQTPWAVWTVRQYSTQPLVCARPQTTNRYEVTSRVYPMHEWQERIDHCLNEIGRTARSMSRWNEVKPETRFMLRPMIPVSLCRSVTITEVPIR